MATKCTVFSASKSGKSLGASPQLESLVNLTVPGAGKSNMRHGLVSNQTPYEPNGKS